MSDNKRLVLNTKKSLYDPIEIVIDEVVYKSVKLTRVTLNEMNKFEKGRKAGDKNEAEGDLVNYRIVHLIFGVPMDTIELLDKREVEDIVLDMQKKLQTTERKRLKTATDAFEITLGDKAQPKRVIPKNPKRPGGKN